MDWKTYVDGASVEGRTQAESKTSSTILVKSPASRTTNQSYKFNNYEYIIMVCGLFSRNEDITILHTHWYLGCGMVKGTLSRKHDMVVKHIFTKLYTLAIASF